MGGGLRLAGNLPLGIVVPLVCKMIGMESFLLHYIHSFVVAARTWVLLWDIFPFFFYFFFFLESQCPSSRCVYHLAVVVHSSGVQDGGAVAITALSSSPPPPHLVMVRGFMRA